mgnify:CR=1 FL=1
MMVGSERFKLLGGVSVVMLVFAMLASPAFAEDVVGRVKSLDADGKKMVVVTEGKNASVDIVIKDSTELINAKGKTKKKVDWAKLKEKADKGKMMVDVVIEKGVASKITLKAGKSKKGKSKSETGKSGA